MQIPFHERLITRIGLVVVVLCVFFVLVFVPILNCIRYPSNLQSDGIIRLGLETPGTHLEKVELSDYVRPTPTAIRVTSPHATFLLRSLEQLRGLVHIQNIQQALHYVRFGISRRYCYNLPNTTIEIVSFSQVASPTFMGSEDLQGEGGDSGGYALLSNRAYRIGKFHPPIIKIIPEGFQIVRWVCLFRSPIGKAVQQWKETVRPDGGYQRTVLKSMPSPDLPNTHWHLGGSR